MLVRTGPISAAFECEGDQRAGFIRDTTPVAELAAAFVPAIVHLLAPNPLNCFVSGHETLVLQRGAERARAPARTLVRPGRVGLRRRDLDQGVELFA